MPLPRTSPRDQRPCRSPLPCFHSICWVERFRGASDSACKLGELPVIGTIGEQQTHLGYEKSRLAAIVIDPGEQHVFLSRSGVRLLSANMPAVSMIALALSS